MPYPVFRKASDLLNADNVVAANYALTKAIRATGDSFYGGMNSLANLAGDEAEAQLMRQVGGIQDRAQYLTALSNPENQALMQKMSADRLRRIMQQRPDRLLNNYATEVGTQTQLAKAMREQTDYDEARGASLLTSELINVTRAGGKEAGATIFPELLRRAQAQGNPTAIAYLTGTASSLGVPTAPVPTVNGQIPEVAAPGMYIDNSGKAVPISRDNLNMLRQDVNTALKHYKNLFPELTTKDGMIKLPNIDEVETKLRNLVEKQNAQNQFKKLDLMDTLDTFHSVLNTLEANTGIPKEFIAAELYTRMDTPNGFTNLFGKDLRFKTDALEKNLKKRGLTFAKDFSNLQRVLEAQNVIENASKTFDSDTQALNTQRVLNPALFLNPNLRAQNMYRLNNAFATKYAPVAEATRTIMSILPEVPNHRDLNPFKPATGSKAKETLAQATKEK